MKVGNGGISPILHGGLRSAGAFLILWLWCRHRGVRLLAADAALAPGLLNGAIFAAEFLCFYIGLEMTSAARAVIFFYTAPFFVALGAHLWLPDDRLSPARLVGLAAAILGVVLAFADRTGGQASLLGDMLCLLAALGWGSTILLMKGSALARAPAERVLGLQLGVSGLALPLASLVAGEAGIFAPSPLVLGALAFQVLIVASGSYLLWGWLIKRYPVSRLSAFTFLTPVIGVALAGLLLGEAVGPMLVAAVALVGVGIFLINRRPAPHARVG